MTTTWHGEAVRTQSPELILGDSLSEFMRKVGIYSTSGDTHTRLRNQMRRLFGCTVSLLYEDARGEATLNAPMARLTEFWWSERQPDARALWESQIERGEDFFNEIIRCPIPIDLNTLRAMQRSPLGLALDRWLTDRPAGGGPHLRLDSAGVRSPRLLWGRASLSCRRQCSIPIQASVRFRNPSSDRHSFRNVPLTAPWTRAVYVQLSIDRGS